MWPYAEVDDVETLFRPLTAIERATADAYIQQAANKLRVRIPNIAALLEVSPLKADLARDAVANAVRRVMQNPEGLRSYSTTEGPFTDSRTFDTATSTAGLFIAEADIAGILPGRRPLARSIRVRSGLA